MALSQKLAIFLLRAGSRTARFRSQDCYTPAFVRPGEGGISIATQREFEDGAGFFEPFQGRVAVEGLIGRDVLDLGCGHGGRTAYYALHGHPRSITGVEINFERVSVADQSAHRLAPGGRMAF